MLTGEVRGRRQGALHWGYSWGGVEQAQASHAGSLYYVSQPIRRHCCFVTLSPFDVLPSYWINPIDYCGHRVLMLLCVVVAGTVVLPARQPIGSSTSLCAGSWQQQQHRQHRHHRQAARARAAWKQPHMRLQSRVQLQAVLSHPSAAVILPRRV
jgi:hypothetical protein